MSIKVDPLQVLIYLNRLGYRHVTAELLSEFVKDLKKLIKYDLMCHQKHLESCEASSSSRETPKYGSSSSYPADSDDSAEGETESVDKRRVPRKARSEKGGSSRRQCKEKPSKEKTAERPRSSYIKSWQIQGPSTSSYRRSDPVALYHQYQTIWKQNKIPGDSDRAGLRWTVRERMIGEDPHPRPVPRSKSCDPATRSGRRTR